MKRAPRPVIVAGVTGRVLRLTVAGNGSDLTVDQVAELCRVAGLEPRVVRATAVLLPASSLPDVEAVAKVARIVVQRRKSPAVEPLTFAPAARQGIDDGIEPVHACARAHCRVPGCRYARRSA